MHVFGIAEAQHFCSSFTTRTGASQGSLEVLVRTLPRQTRTLTEGTPIFDDYRACLLRDVDRFLFLSASHYCRFHDLLISSAAPWSFVTAYYGTWFAAQAILGMFGCRVFA